MSEDTIFQEVNEELRRDRMRSGWRRYGAYVIGAAVLLVVAVAAYEGWNWWQNDKATRSSDQLYAALKLDSGGDLAGAQKALDTLIQSGSGGYPVLAKFSQAGLLARQGKTAEAQAAYDALATSEGNSRLRGLALLFAANLLVDKGDVAGVKSRVVGLLAPNDPMRDAAEETIGLAQYKAGDLNGARDSFTNVMKDPEASQQTRGRMQIYIAQLIAQGATVPGAPAEAAPKAAAPAAPAAGVAKPAATTPAPAAAPAPAASGTPAGVESNQPMVPDPALEMAAPAAPAPAATTTPDTAAPTLSTGAGLPTAPDGQTAPAVTPGSVTQPAGTTTAPDTAPASAAAAAPAAAPAETPAPASPSGTAAPASATPIPPAGATPASK